jgi:hypothetical protein
MPQGAKKVFSVFNMDHYCSYVFDNISAITWRSVLLVEETGVPGETTNMSQVTDKLYHIMLYRLSGIRTRNVSGDNTDCIGSCKSNDHTITTTTDGPMCRGHFIKYLYEKKKMPFLNYFLRNVP